MSFEVVMSQFCAFLWNYDVREITHIPENTPRTHRHLSIPMLLFYPNTAFLLYSDEFYHYKIS